MRFFASFLLTSLVALSPLAAQQQPAASPQPTTAKADAKPDDKAKDKSASSTDASAQKDFDIPVPEGVPVKGIRVPHYDENGQLVMLMNADVARKIDPDHIEMENLKIDAYSDDGRRFTSSSRSPFLISKIAC